jgi:hypothetical protein
MNLHRASISARIYRRANEAVYWETLSLAREARMAGLIILSLACVAFGFSNVYRAARQRPEELGNKSLLINGVGQHLNKPQINWKRILSGLALLGAGASGIAFFVMYFLRQR